VLLPTSPPINLLQVAWKDEANPGAGFEYLYLAEADYLALPEGTVDAQKVEVGGEVRESCWMWNMYLQWRSLVVVVLSCDIRF